MARGPNSSVKGCAERRGSLQSSLGLGQGLLKSEERKRTSRKGQIAGTRLAREKTTGKEYSENGNSLWHKRKEATAIGCQEKINKAKGGKRYERHKRRWTARQQIASS